MKRCTACFGNKRVMGLGLMEDDCLRCKGTGVIKDEAIPVIDLSLEKEPKKKGKGISKED